MRQCLLLGLSVAGCSEGAPEDSDPNGTGGVVVPPSATCEGASDALSASAEAVESNLLGRTVEVSFDTANVGTVWCTLTDTPDIWTEPVPFGATWSFLDTGAFPGADWMLPDFDSSAWLSGVGMFGYGDAAATTLPNVSEVVTPIVTWYRTEFTIADASAVSTLGVQLVRDDGAVVYINGVEAVRDKMPEGVIGPTSVAVLKISGSDEELMQRLPVDASLLVDGRNVVAVEVHQDGPSSTDVSFDLRLTALTANELPNPPEVITATGTISGTQSGVALVGLLPDATYACSAGSACGGATVAFDVTTEPLPDWAPRLARHPNSGEPVSGTWTLFNHQKPCAFNYDNRLLIVDPEGQVRWYYSIPQLNTDSTIDIEALWLGDGGILWGGGDDPTGKPQIVGLDHQVRHEAGWTGAESSRYHHDLAMIEGDIVGMLSVDVSDGATTWKGFDILRYNPDTQEEVWRWRSQDAFDRGELPYPVDVDHPDDAWHANSFAWTNDADGEAVYINLLYEQTIIRVDVATGTVGWRLGAGGDFALVDEAGVALPEDNWFAGLHGLHVTDGLVTLYDNGRNPSYAITLRLDLGLMQAEQVQRWTEFGWYEPIWGDVDRTSNGDLLIDMAHNECQGGNAFHVGSLVDVRGSDGSVAWRIDMLDGEDSSYRSQRIDACDLFNNSRWCPTP